MDFDRDDAKAEANERKHGVSFSESVAVFGDPPSLTGYDPKYADHEDRFLTMGTSIDGRSIAVSHTDRAGSVRIISRVGWVETQRNLQVGSRPSLPGL